MSNHRNPCLCCSQTTIKMGGPVKCIFSLITPLSESAAVDVKRPVARQGNFLRKSERRRGFSGDEGSLV